MSQVAAVPVPAIAQPPVQAHDTHEAPVPEPAAEPVVPAYVPPRPAAVPMKAAAAKTGPNVGVIAGAAVAAVTVIAAGVGIMLSGKKSSAAPAKKPAASRAAASRPAAKASAAKPSARCAALLAGLWSAAAVRLCMHSCHCKAAAASNMGIEHPLNQQYA